MSSQNFVTTHYPVNSFFMPVVVYYLLNQNKNKKQYHYEYRTTAHCC